MTDFRDKVIEAVQERPKETILLAAMALLLVCSILITAENASAECSGTYHQDTRCLISVSDCWGAANHECRSHKQMAKCINYSDDAFDYWNTTLNITQVRYDRRLCKCSYWCMNITKPTSTSTTQKWTTVATTTTTQPKPTKPTTTTLYWISLPKNTTLPAFFQDTLPPTATPEQKPPPTPQSQTLLWLIILIFLVPAAIEDIRTGLIDRRLTLGFSIAAVTYALASWNTTALLAGGLVTLISYTLTQIKYLDLPLANLGDVILAPGATAALILLHPQREEILVASIGTLSYVFFYLRKRQWKWQTTTVPYAACLLTYYIAILTLRIGLQIQ